MFVDNVMSATRVNQYIQVHPTDTHVDSVMRRQAAGNATHNRCLSQGSALDAPALWSVFLFDRTRKNDFFRHIKYKFYRELGNTGLCQNVLLSAAVAFVVVLRCASW